MCNKIDEVWRKLKLTGDTASYSMFLKDLHTENNKDNKETWVINSLLNIENVIHAIKEFEIVPEDNSLKPPPIYMHTVELISLKVFHWQHHCISWLTQQHRVVPSKRLYWRDIHMTKKYTVQLIRVNTYGYCKQILCICYWDVLVTLQSAN